ncbi:MAG: S1 RNA-binding domain-containing protein [Candidatus Brocadiaceae bacterium]|nr:S1 RNA-binding domain-containing protein [Candidatus Brocadiaceae bacterium]
MPEKALKSVAARYHLTAEQANEILRLLDAGFSIPYVMRYHKELAGSLEADGFHELMEERRRLEKLDSRRRKVLKKLQEREILTDELEEKISRAADMRELIDHYVPYRPRKRSHSRQALAQGLQDIAAKVLSQEEFVADMKAAAEPYVDAEKGLADEAAVLEGVFHIVSDWVAEERSHRNRQREVFRQEAEIVVRRVSRSLPGRMAREFKQYFDYRQKVARLHPYHMLSILRGKRMKALQYRFEPPLEPMIRAAAELYFPGGVAQWEQIRAEMGANLPGPDGRALQGLNGPEFLAACINYSLGNILTDIAARELDKDLCKQAEELALDVIRRNVTNLLMAKPVRCRMIGIHPGYRSGCNLAVVDEAGELLETTTVYPHPPQNQPEEAKRVLVQLVETHRVEMVAIGDGTGAQETEALVAELIAGPLPDLRYTVVSEVGVEAYARSRSAKNELAEVAPDERYAVALCRRLQDPLSELVKVNPRELCPAPYAEDVNGGALKKLLDRVLEECVCRVGVEVNTAHFSLLRYVSGLGPEKALEVVEYRDRYGALKNRRQLREVPKIDQAAYDQAAGFLRVQDSDCPLDRTRIHTRFYPVAEEICRQLEIAVADLGDPDVRAKVKERASEIKLADLEKQFGVHYLLLKDIITELAEPWPDPRADGQGPLLRRRRPTLEDLEADEWVSGTVRNIVDFGVFVDIGVGEDGLVHISELSDSYVQSPYDVVSVGDVVQVRVVRVELDKKRIALSMRSESARRERPRREPRQRRERESDRSEPRPVREVPVGPLAGGIRTPRSTLGVHSRRVEKASLNDGPGKGQAAVARKPVPSDEQPPAPRPAAPGEQEQKVAGEPAPDVQSLLGRLGLGSIERRGKQSD